MKKIYLLIFSLLAWLVPTWGQGLGESWWGVRAGVNFSNLSSPDYSTDYLTGFSVGLSYNHPISESVPIYIESGLYFQKSGARDNGFLVEEGAQTKFSRYGFEVPLLLGVAVPMARPWSIHAAVGLYYSVATSGSFKMDGSEFDPYRDAMLRTLRDSEPSEQQLLHRSDIGARVVVSLLYGRYLFGFTYDVGFTNLYTAQLRDEGYQAHAGCFTLQFGCNF